LTAAESLQKQGSAIDMVTMRQELSRLDLLERAGGAAYLTSLTDGMPRAVNIEHYAQIVKEKSTLRHIIQTSNEAMARAYQGEEKSSEILTDMESNLFAIAAREADGKGFLPIEPIVSQVFREIEECVSRKSLIDGIPTGFTELDRITGGLHSGELIVVAARPGVGKTSLALNIATSAAGKPGKRVGIFSLEMSRSAVTKRMILAEAEVDRYKARSGYLNSEDWFRISAAAGKISQLPIYIEDSHDVTVLKLQARAHQLKRKVGLDLLVVDYMQLLDGGKKTENRTQEISQISRSLKHLAKALGVPVIALSQLNREIEKRKGGRPQLSDLRESGSIEQDADVVIFIHREDAFNPTHESNGIAEIIIGKQRDGETGSFQLAFVKQFTKFANLFHGTDGNS
jgi:replicative DNA helicase